MVMARWAMSGWRAIAASHWAGVMLRSEAGGFWMCRRIGVECQEAPRRATNRRPIREAHRRHYEI